MKDVVSYRPTNFGELETFCKRITGTAMVPTAYRGKPDDAAVAIMFGNEIGLPPMTSLQFVAVINGRPGIYGDAMPGIAMNKGLIADMREHMEGEPLQDSYTAVCVVTRPNGGVVEQRFSVADAKKANLWGKAGPWTQYPRRMLQWRARSWAIRDAAPNLLFGMSAEEMQDIEIAEQHRGPDSARDITPAEPSVGPRAAAEAALQAADPFQEAEVVDENGEVHDNPDPLKLLGIKGAMSFMGALRVGLEQATALDADRYWELYKAKAKAAEDKLKTGDYASLEAIVLEKLGQWNKA